MGDDFIVISDIEIPNHSVTYLRRALLVAMAHGIKRLIIAGDTIATDQQALNEWIATIRGRNESRYEDDINDVQQLLDAFAAWFDEILIIEGNHDDRVARATKGEVHLGMLIRGDKVTYSRYAYLWLKTSRGWAYICHPRQFSHNSAGLGQRIYNKLVAPDGGKPAFVILAHTSLVAKQDGVTTSSKTRWRNYHAGNGYGCSSR